MEVDMSWLEKEEAAAKAKGPPPLPKAKGPPPMPKGPPPMPKGGGPIRRETIDVRLDWLEEAEQAVEAARVQRRSSTAIEAVKSPRRPSTTIEAAKPKRTKQPWEPPSLPPPPPNAVKSRAVRAPLPREEPDDPPKRPSKRPPGR